MALGAISEGSHETVRDSVAWFIGVPRDVIETIAERERVEVARRIRLYRHTQPLPDVRGRAVVLVDDGLATGATLRVAALALRKRRPAHLVAAVPVASAAHCDEVRRCVDELVALATPEPFQTVSAWYDDFGPVTDGEVLRLLRRLLSPSGSGDQSALPISRGEGEVYIPVPVSTGRATLVGDLGVPNAARGLVILAHGGGSSRHSYRNRYLAGRLRLAGWATLRVDLLTEAEQGEDDEWAMVRFDIDRIAQRLRSAAEWAATERIDGANHMVLFGASTGAAAALIAAAERPDLIAAVMSRGGRVDLAGAVLAGVRAPVFMIVGGADRDTLERSRAAAKLLPRRPSLTVVSGAGHIFEEPGALGAVGERAVRWLESVLDRGSRRGWIARVARLAGARHLFGR